MSDGRIIGVIPAAGRSRRFGGEKQLHPVDGTPLLLRVLAAVCGSCAATVLVTRQSVWDALATRVPDGVHFAAADDPDAEMIDSIRIGIAAARTRLDLGGDDGVLVCPGDLPRLAPADVACCCARFSAEPERLVVASHGGRRGHPLIFPAALCATVEGPDCDGGLRALLGRHARDLVEVACESDGVLHDVDTRADLAE